MSYFILGVALRIITCPPPFTQGRREGADVGEGHDPPADTPEGCPYVQKDSRRGDEGIAPHGHQGRMTGDTVLAGVGAKNDSSVFHGRSESMIEERKQTALFLSTIVLALTINSSFLGKPLETVW